jgi:hypothetical protein
MKTLLIIFAFLSLRCITLNAQTVQPNVADSVEYKIIIITSNASGVQPASYFWIDVEDNEDGTLVVMQGTKGRSAVHYNSRTAALKSYTSKGWRVHTMSWSDTGSFGFLLERNVKHFNRNHEKIIILIYLCIDCFMY